jgi:hypothetical protein
MTDWRRAKWIFLDRLIAVIAALKPRYRTATKYERCVARASNAIRFAISARRLLPSKYPRINSRLRSLEAYTQTITAPPPRHHR